MMQKNFAGFIVVCLVIIMGWVWLQNQLWPPRQPDPNQVAQKDAKKQDEEKKDPAKKDDEKKQEEKKPEDKKPEDKKPEVKPPPKPEIKEKAAPEPEPETIALGSDKTYLQVKLTTRGAGVQQVVLTRFQAANYLGEPEKRQLELVQDDPFLPSFLMYHFAEDPPSPPVLGLGEKTWKLEGREQLADGAEAVKFSVRVPGREDVKITKTYRLGPRDYHLGLTLEFERDGQGGDGKDSKFRYQLAGAHGLPVEGEWYTATFRNAMIGTLDARNNLWRDMQDAHRISHKLGGDRVPEGDRGDSMLQYAGVATQYFAAMIVVDDVQADKNVDRRKILAWARPTLESTERRGKILNIAADAITIAESGAGNQTYQLLPHVHRHIVESRLKQGDQVMLAFYETPDGKRIASWVRRGQEPRPMLADITVRVNSESIDLHPGAKATHQFLLYHGPVKTRLLGDFSGDKAVDSALVDRYTDTLHLRTLTDYGSVGFFRSIGWSGLLIFTTKVMHILLHYLSYLVFGSYGLSIILLTVVVRGAMFPISKRQAMWSMRMQELAPEMKKLHEKYKHDPQAKMEATRELYRKHKINPISGCLPMFLQLPIFLGLYYALQESIHFRLAGFLWVDNLAAPDMLVWWGESIPWVSNPDSQGGILYLGPYFNILPIFAVALMFIQQKLMTPPPADEQQAVQQKTFQIMMIFMGVLFYKVASGLCIYFIASSLWGVAERKLLPKKKTGEAVAPASSNGKAQTLKPKGKAQSKPSGNGDAKDGLWQRLKAWWADLLEQARKK